MPRRLLPLLLAATCLLPGQAPPGRPTPPADQGYRAYLWVGDDLLRERLTRKAIAALGFRGVSLEPQEPLEPLAREGIPFYLDQVVGGEILYVKEGTYQLALARSLADPPDLARPRCLRDPAVLAEARGQIASRLARFTEVRPDFVSLRDEISFTRLINPVDWCGDERCQEAFAAFARDRWGSLERLQACWGGPKGGPVPNWTAASGGAPARLRPPTTQEARHRFFQSTRAPEALVPWNDAREFADASFAAALRTLVTAARDALPAVPIGFLGGQMPSAFGGFDWQRLLPLVNVVEPYDYGAAQEIVRSLAAPGTLAIHTLFASKAVSVASIHELYHYFLHGDAGTIVFSSAEVFPENNPEAPSAWASALAPHLRFLSGPQGTRFRQAAPPPPQVAVLLSMPSIRVHWMLDSAEDGASWPRRLTSVENSDSSEAQNRRAWTAILADLGLRAAFVTPQDLERGALNAPSLGALVLPRTLALSATEVSAIREFLGRGRLVVADSHAGLFDERLREISDPPLDKWLGVSRTGHDLRASPDRPATGPVMPYPLAEPGLVATSGRALRMAGSVPVLVQSAPETPIENGRTLYLNLRIGGYAEDRLLRPERAAWLLDQLRPHFRNSEVRPELPIAVATPSAPWPVETIVRKEGKDLLVAFQVNLRPTAPSIPWDRIVADPGVRFTVQLAGTYRITDLRTGQDLGVRNSLVVEIRPDHPALLSLRR